MNGRSSSQPGFTGSSTKTLICPPVPTLTATDTAWRATDPAKEHHRCPPFGVHRHGGKAGGTEVDGEVPAHTA
jgi:hypothetical protein